MSSFPNFVPYRALYLFQKQTSGKLDLVHHRYSGWILAAIEIKRVFAALIIGYITTSALEKMASWIRRDDRRMCICWRYTDLSARVATEY